MSIIDQLLHTATIIRDETVAKKNTPIRVGGLLLDIVRRFLVKAEDLDLWVDPINGSDSNTGTQASPFATYARARSSIPDYIPASITVVVHLLPHSDPEGYNEEEFWDWPIIHGTFRIKGEGVIVGQTDIALTARNNRTYDFSGAAPGWTEGEWSGWDIVVGSTSSEGIVEGQPRTVVWNTADTIVTATIHAKFPTFEVVSPGDTFRIVRPAVAINTSPRADDDLARHIVGGVNNSGNSNLFRPFDGNLIFENLEMRQPDGESRDVFVTGHVTFFGTHITQDHTSYHKWIINRANVRCGPYTGTDALGYGTEDYLYGWGLSGRSRSSGGIRPGIDVFQSSFDAYFAGGGLVSEEGTDWRLQAGIFDGTGRTGFPHASIYTRHSFFGTNDSTRENFYVIGFDDGFCLESEHGFLEVFHTMQLIGGRPIARARYLGQVVIAKTPNVQEAIGAGLYTTAQYGGQIRITGWDGNELGDTRCGSNTFTDRSAGAWSVGEHQDGEASSHIYRTS